MRYSVYHLAYLYSIVATLTFTTTATLHRAYFLRPYCYTICIALMSGYLCEAKSISAVDAQSKEQPK